MKNDNLLPWSRRDFLARMAQTSLALPLVVSAANTSDADSFAAQITNEYFAAAFDAKTGRLFVRRTNGAPLLAGALFAANTSRGRRQTTSPAYSHTIDRNPVADVLGEGVQLRVFSRDAEHVLDLELRLTLYKNHPCLLLEAVAKNVSAEPIFVPSLEPLCATRQAGGALFWPETAKILTNGQLYADPGSLLDTPAEPRRSWWNIGFFRGYDREGLVCGYVQNQVALGQLLVNKEAGGALSLTAESVFAPGLVLQPGQQVSSNPFLLNIAGNPYAALEAFADVMGALNSARRSSPLNGWCSWFYTYEHVTEDEVVRNAEFVARALKPYGLEYIQVDEGYQRWHGDWEANAKFPHGMKWLAERISSLGLKPGLWIAPYVISEPAEVFQQHPDWLLRHPDGRLKRVGPWPSEDAEWARNENPKRYGLDITHPQAAEWLGKLFHTVAHEWGYRFIKIDFVAWSLLAAERYYDPTVSPAAAYRKGFEIMRRNIGPDCHLQDCGPGPVTVGLLDSMRIELDSNYGFRDNAWQTYFIRPTSSSAAAGKRYYFHQRAWLNDADHVCLHLLSQSQAQAAATIIALSGGNLLSGDRLPDLDPSRLAILQKITPTGGEAARPVDLFDTDLPQVFALPLKKPFGEWTIAGFFNPDDKKTLAYSFPVERLWLDPTKSYIAYDFWQERFYGLVEGQVRVIVPPAGVTLLSLHEKRTRPQVIGTDRHVLQGFVELAEVQWDAAASTLSGRSLGPIGSAHRVLIYVPEPHPWRQGGYCIFHDKQGYSYKMVDDHLLSLFVRFEQNDHIAWKIDFRELFG